MRARTHFPTFVILDFLIFHLCGAEKGFICDFSIMSDNEVFSLHEVVRLREGVEPVTLKDVMRGRVVVDSADGRDQKKHKKNVQTVVLAEEQEEEQEDEEEQEQEGQQREVEQNEEELVDGENVAVPEQVDDEVIAKALELESENDEEDDAETRRAELLAINKKEGMERVESKKKKTRLKNVKVSWSPYETEMFFDNIRLFGTDFLLGSDKFPNRTHKQMTRKLRVEEKQNPEVVDWVLRNPIDFPEEIDPYTLDLPCQLEGYAKKDLDKYYQVLLESVVFFFVVFCFL
jgi:hypothetical protein